MATATASCATIFSSARHGVRAAVGGAAAASSSRRQAVRHATAAAAMAPGHHHPLAAHAQRMSTSALWRPRAVCSSSVRPLSTSPSRRVPSDDPGGKPIPTDGSYRTVYDDFNNITASEEPQLSVHSMGDSTFTMTDGLVARMPIIMLNKQVFLWDAPPLGGQDTQGNDVLVMPTGRGWEAWTDDVWRIFGVVQPRPEIIIFGTGRTVLPIPVHIKQHLNRLGIQIEAHSSRNACSTYNMLAEEQRLVAAAILPNVRKPTERVAATEAPVESPGVG